MFPVSTYYKNTIKQSSVEYDWYGTIQFENTTSISFNKAVIDQNKSKITRQCVTGENLEIGNVYSAELRLVLRDSDTWKISDKTYDFQNAMIHIYFKLYIPTQDAWEDVPCGIFYVKTAERTYHTVTLTAYDSASKFSKKMNERFTGSFTPYAAIQSVCSLCSVNLGMSEQAVQALPNGTREDLKMHVYKKGTSYRDVLGNICTLLGANAFVNRYGMLMLVQYGQDSVRALSPSERYSTSYVDYVGRYEILYAQNKKGEVETYGEAEPPSIYRRLAMNIGKNTLLNKYDEDEESSPRTTIILNILDYLRNVIYSPCNVTMPCDPSIDPGDMISFIGGEITGIYTETLDTTVVTEKTYYQRISGGRYIPVTPVGTENPHEEDWFEVGASALCTKIEMPLYGQMKITSEAGSYDLDIDPYATEKEEEKKKDNDDNNDKWENQERKNDDNDDKWEDQDQHNEDTDNALEDLSGEVGQLARKLAINYIFPYEIAAGEISDGESATVLRFKFTAQNEGDAVSFYSMLTFTVETTVEEIEIPIDESIPPRTKTILSYGDCTLTVNYYFDDALTHSVLHTYGDGHAILTLNGCYPGLSAGEHTFDVEFELSGGSIS